MTAYMVDANIFLEVELKQERGRFCKAFLNKLKRGEVEGLTTDFIVDTIAIIMEDYGKTWAEIRKFLLSLTRYTSLRIYSLSLADRIMTTEFMRLYNLDFDDGTTYQAMRACDINQIISYDNHFNNIPQLKRVIPGEIIK
ncbi:MAG: hypothetical protein AOA65_1997 [Candidatus Bathyarchaeota archaeon BA1]|nr:MAG: hypothetical protein AOA65_1997 [Candidatus Bathyarchaeota archaeon BA1]